MTDKSNLSKNTMHVDVEETDDRCENHLFLE